MELITDEVFRNNVEGEQNMLDPFRWDHVERFGVDLTAGEHCVNVTKAETVRLGEAQELEVRPGDFVIVDTDEYLRVPDSCLGLLLPKVSLMLRGLSQSGGKVDPGFRGRLRVALKNEGYEVVKLKRGEPICNVAFWRIQ